MQARRSGEYAPGSCFTTEKSWAARRAYIDKALQAFSPEHRAETGQAPGAHESVRHAGGYRMGVPICAGEWQLTLSEWGGIGSLTHRGAEVLRRNGSLLSNIAPLARPITIFRLSHYSCKLKENVSWVYGDFGRLLLRYVDGKYPQGFVACRAVKAGLLEEGTVCVDLECDAKLCGQLGALRLDLCAAGKRAFDAGVLA